MAARPATAAAAQAARSRTRRRVETMAGRPVREPPSAIHCSSAITSRALCQRSSGSFSRHLRTTWSRAGELMASTVAMAGGWEEMMAAIRLVRLLPSKALRPVAIS